MRIIQKSDSLALKILGTQQKKGDTSRRFLTYCVAAPCAEGILLHNVMTKEMLLLEGEEANALTPDALNASQILSYADAPLFSYLYENWYIVPQDHDDKGLCISLRAVALQINKNRNGGMLTGFTILTTTACNARCFYCYERGCEYEDMSRETALKVVDFIRRSCGGKHVSLHWFGGEPLLNIEPMDIITSGLEREGVEFNSSMTTNGYLFDEELVRKAKERWKLGRLQITIDGTEEEYNKRKAYIYKDGSAFMRVTDNIERLLKADINVDVRLNLDEKNFNDLIALAGYFNSRYGKYDKFSAYSHYIHNGKGSKPFSGDMFTLSKYTQELNARLPKDREKDLKIFNKRIAFYQCMGDSDSSIVIQTDGNLSMCEHFFNSHPCGTIEKGICNTNEVEHFKEADVDLEICNTCSVYPNCVRIAACPYSFAHSKEKTSYRCAEKETRLRHAMLSVYCTSQ